MDFADQGGLDQATSWVSGNTGATQLDAPPANPAPAAPPEGGTTNTQGAQPPEGGTTNAPPAPEDLTPYRELVENLGGLDGVRQFDPLYKALADPSGDFDKIGRGVSNALKQMLGNDQYGAMVMALHDEFGELLAEEFVAAHPEWLQAQVAKIAGGKPPEGEDVSDDDDYGQLPEGGTTNAMTPREKELTERLTALEGQLNQMTQTRQQTAERQFRASVEKEVFGTVVDKTFAQLQGWEDAELQQVVRLAMSEFSFDPKAKESFDAATNYLRTKQPLLANQVVKAQSAFQNHLKNAMELVDLKRQAARKTAAPVEPDRKEFGAGAPAQPDTRQPTNREQNEQFWNVDQLLGAVKNRLREKGVPA